MIQYNYFYLKVYLTTEITKWFMRFIVLKFTEKKGVLILKAGHIRLKRFETCFDC